MAKTFRTWQPKKLKRLRKHGFRSKMETTDGRKILQKRRLQGRQRLAI